MFKSFSKFIKELHKDGYEGLSHSIIWGLAFLGIFILLIPTCSITSIISSFNKSSVEKYKYKGMKDIERYKESLNEWVNQKINLELDDSNKNIIKTMDKNSKDIKGLIENQKDLVEITNNLTKILNVTQDSIKKIVEKLSY